MRTLALLPLLAACGGTAETEAPTRGAVADAAPEKKADAAAFDRSRLSAFGELPEVMASESNPITEEKVTLGRILYYETRMSAANDLSCNSCHQLDAYGVDGEPTSPGHEGQRGDRNSPTVYNAAGHIAQFWDGRSPDVEDQAKGPILNPVEMAMPDEGSVVARIKGIEGYAPLFAAAFPDDADPITYDNIAKAIGAFERKLVTEDRFDAFLAGDDSALTAEEKAGLVAYMDAGCTTCHAGPYLGGNMYQKVGLVKPWPNQDDPGRAKVTGSDADKMSFKVPSLRNIAKTGPYFHDGSVAELDKAVDMMAEHQLGRDLSDEQIASITTFLGALTGEIPEEYVKKPELPQ